MQAVAEPEAAAPAAPAPVFKPSDPVVQATPPVEERIAAATAASEAEQATARPAARTVAPRPQPAPAPRAEAVAERAPALQAAPVAPATAPEPAVPEAAPVMAAPEAAPVAAAAPEQSMRTDDALLWALGGSALLMLGLGGAALVRRRRSDDAAAEAVPAFEPSLIPAAAAMPAMARPVALRPQVAPAAAAPIAATAPADATLEAMVAAPPSAENPFTTRTKRLRRATFLLAQREEAAAHRAAPQTIDAEPAMAPAMDRSQAVYRFGSDRQRQGFLKPRTS